MQITATGLRWVAPLTLIGMLLVWSLIFFSEPYSEARRFVRSDHRIESDFGRINYAILYVANIKNSRARFRVYLIGEKARGGVVLRAKRENGSWIVSEDE